MRAIHYHPISQQQQRHQRQRTFSKARGQPLRHTRRERIRARPASAGDFASGHLSVDDGRHPLAYFQGFDSKTPLLVFMDAVMVLLFLLSCRATPLDAAAFVVGHFEGEARQWWRIMTYHNRGRPHTLSEVWQLLQARYHAVPLHPALATTKPSPPGDPSSGGTLEPPFWSIPSLLSYPHHLTTPFATFTSPFASPSRSPSITYTTPSESPPPSPPESPPPSPAESPPPSPSESPPPSPSESSPSSPAESPPSSPKTATLSYFNDDYPFIYDDDGDLTPTEYLISLSRQTTLPLYLRDPLASLELAALSPSLSSFAACPSLFLSRSSGEPDHLQDLCDLVRATTLEPPPQPEPAPAWALTYLDDETSLRSQPHLAIGLPFVALNRPFDLRPQLTSTSSSAAWTLQPHRPLHPTLRAIPAAKTFGQASDGPFAGSWAAPPLLLPTLRQYQLHPPQHLPDDPFVITLFPKISPFFYDPELSVPDEPVLLTREELATGDQQLTYCAQLGDRVRVFRMLRGEATQHREAVRVLCGAPVSRDGLDQGRQVVLVQWSAFVTFAGAVDVPPSWVPSAWAAGEYPDAVSAFEREEQAGLVVRAGVSWDCLHNAWVI